jgi:transcriptional regulator with XRE-family HTH domain
MRQSTTKSNGIADRMVIAPDTGGAAIGMDGSPLLVLRHSPEALHWVRRQRGWTNAELARASSIAPSTISQLESGSRNAGPATLAKLASALRCPLVVLEAGQINEVATSAASALEILDRLLSVSDPAYLTRCHGFVQLGFVAAGRHIGTLHVRERDFKELMNALRRHFPNRNSTTAHNIAKPKVRGTTYGYRAIIEGRHSAKSGLA